MHAFWVGLLGFRDSCSGVPVGQKEDFAPKFFLSWTASKANNSAQPP